MMEYNEQHTKGADQYLILGKRMGHERVVKLPGPPAHLQGHFPKCSTLRKNLSTGWQYLQNRSPKCIPVLAAVHVFSNVDSGFQRNMMLLWYVEFDNNDTVKRQFQVMPIK